jgi:Transglycosylase SLT domain
MSKLLKSFRRQKSACARCLGQGFIGEGPKRRECPKCRGLGQYDQRPEKNGKIVVGGMILGLFLLFCIAKLFTKPASAAESPTESTALSIIETAEPATSENAVQQAPCHVSPNYPEGIMQWCTLITGAAHKNDIPSDLIAAVILQESGGQADIISDSGAVGLMQVMPRDGNAASFQCINGPCFASRPTAQELLDPEYNINYGAKMLAGLIGKLRSTREALKAYGPMDMDYAYADKVLSIMDNLSK